MEEYSNGAGFHQRGGRAHRAIMAVGRGQRGDTHRYDTPAPPLESGSVRMNATTGPNCRAPGEPRGPEARATGRRNPKPGDEGGRKRPTAADESRGRRRWVEKGDGRRGGAAGAWLRDDAGIARLHVRSGNARARHCLIPAGRELAERIQRSARRRPGCSAAPQIA